VLAAVNGLIPGETKVVEVLYDVLVGQQGLEIVYLIAQIFALDALVVANAFQE